MEEYTDSIAEIVFDLAHEYRHAFQHFVAFNQSNIITHDFENIEKWKEEIINYEQTPFKLFDDYLSLSVEMDANAFAEAISEIFASESLIQLTKSLIPLYYCISEDLGKKYEYTIAKIKETYFRAL